MADNGGHYDPRAQAMEEIHFDWRCIVCCMVALSPLHLEQQHLPGTESVYFDLDNTPWVKCDKCEKRLCPDDRTPAKKQKKQPRSSAKKTPTTAKSSDMGHYGDSAHKNKKIGLFTVEAMTKCIEEVKAVEARQKKLGLAQPEKS